MKVDQLLPAEPVRMLRSDVEIFRSSSVINVRSSTPVVYDRCTILLRQLSLQVVLLGDTIMQDVV
jgi:hypothetical protein